MPYIIRLLDMDVAADSLIEFGSSGVAEEHSVNLMWSVGRTWFLDL